MDFLQFLENSSKIKNDSKSDKTIIITNKDKENAKKKSNNSKNDVENEDEFTEPKHINYQNLKKGDHVKIVYLENSPFNYYKGYIAEIREYIKGAEHAFVCLPAQNTQNKLKISIKQFIKL